MRERPDGFHAPPALRGRPRDPAAGSAGGRGDRASAAVWPGPMPAPVIVSVWSQRGPSAAGDWGNGEILIRTWRRGLPSHPAVGASSVSPPDQPGVFPRRAAPPFLRVTSCGPALTGHTGDWHVSLLAPLGPKAERNARTRALDSESRRSAAVAGIYGALLRERKARCSAGIDRQRHSPGPGYLRSPGPGSRGKGNGGGRERDDASRAPVIRSALRGPASGAMETMKVHFQATVTPHLGRGSFRDCVGVAAPLRERPRRPERSSRSRVCQTRGERLDRIRARKKTTAHRPPTDPVDYCSYGCIDCH
ncbi:hypothetical protein AAFF_G00243930 [Aldrovandia affinis]|uniref:Uncharacterized protein n=1 Tax=Aldrovandia affinis TaxID=143900 RepID=A0AAD7REA0_9TELE|nr:hypothetical protein AAFF_G00243930 [Aldrovandia affinis]